MVPPDLFPDVYDRPPEVPREELDGEVVRSAIVHHGCLLVRNVLDEERVHAARTGIDRSIEALAVRAGRRP